MLHLVVTSPDALSARVALSGDLDRSGVAAVGSLVVGLAPQLRRAELDLTALDFVDVAGWRALAAAVDDLGRRGVRVEVTGSAASDRVAALLGDLPTRIAS